MSDYPQPNSMMSPDALFAKLDAEAAAAANAIVDVDRAAAEGRVVPLTHSSVINSGGSTVGGASSTSYGGGNGSSNAAAAVATIPNIHKILRSNTLDLAALEEELALGNVNVRSPRGKTPLMAAGYYGHKKALERLLEKGAVIDAIHEKSGDTAAHFVCLSLVGNIRQSGCIMILIENGASIDRKNDDGFTVFELARKNGNREIGATGDALMHS